MTRPPDSTILGNPRQQARYPSTATGHAPCPMAKMSGWGTIPTPVVHGRRWNRGLLGAR